MVQVWYPARTTTRARASYLYDQGLAAVLDTLGYYGADSSIVRAWARLSTNSEVDAPIAPGRHPLLTFSVGLGVIRANYTSIGEELASRGLTVALVESPFEGLFVDPNDQIVTDTTQHLNDARVHRRAVAALRQRLLSQKIPRRDFAFNSSNQLSTTTTLSASPLSAWRIIRNRLSSGATAYSAPKV
jgi:hypothetical protein